MKPRLVVAALFLVTLGVALYLFHVFDASPTSTTETLPVPPPPGETPGLVVPAAKEPRDEPQPEYPEFPAPTRVLILGQQVRSFTAWLAQLFNYGQKVQFQAWYAVPPQEGAETHSDGLPALAAQPTAQDLDGVQVLIVSALDPSRLPAEFWSSVADRVRGGSLGLLLVPDSANGVAMSEIPALKALLPVAKVRPLEPVAVGGPIAGVYSPARPILLADDAAEHPATRLVGWKDWNRKWWAGLGTGASVAAWTTKFCSPVESLAPGARVLAHLATGVDAAPALVATSGDARVLWAGGFFDLEKAAYTDSRSVLAFRVLVHQWALWLAPPKS